MKSLPDMTCASCHTRPRPASNGFTCPECGRRLSLPLVPYRRPPSEGHGLWRYAQCLPLSDGLSLGEGCSPLVRARSMEVSMGLKGLHLKLETGNPSGSFKDRGSALVMNAAMRAGYTRAAIASTGNAAASSAAYASRFGISLTVLVPSSCEASKMWQVTSRGGRITQVEGDFIAAEEAYGALAADGWFPGGSDNPLRTEGTKTLAYEIFEQTRSSGLDRVIVPVGTGSLIAGIHKGFMEIVAAGELARPPRIDGVQIEKVAPLPAQLEGLTRDPSPSPASGINIQRALLAREAMEAIESSGGRLRAVSDDDVLAAQRALALMEGVGAEPTGAVSVAAVRAAARAGEIDICESVVAVVTGSLKDGIL